MIGGARGAAAGWNVLLSALVIAVLVFLDRCVLGGSVPVAGTAGGREVRGMRPSMLVLAICASCTVDQTGAMSLVAGRAPNAPPGDLFDGAAPADAVQWDAVPPPAPDAAGFPSCAAIGYVETTYRTCDPGKRTADQVFTCAICAQLPPAQWCRSISTAGDRSSLCVPTCGSCPVALNCDRDPCVVIDGGAL